MGRFIKTSLLLVNFFAVIALIGAYMSRSTTPLENGYLPFIGLAFPALSLLNLFFIAFWQINGSRWAMLSFFTMLLGFNAWLDYYGNPFTGNKEDGEYKILSHNVRLFGFYQWDENIQLRDSMMASLAEEQADILCFQEFYVHEEVGGFKTKPLVLKATKAPHMHEKYTHEFRDQYFGVVTMSKHPILFKGNIEFAQDYNNYCIYTDILLPSDDTIRIFNAHLASIHFRKADYDLLEGEDKEMDKALGRAEDMMRKLKKAFERRAPQIEQIMEEVKKSPYPTILAGDFNDTPISYTYGLMRDALDDAYRDCEFGIGNTYNGPIPYLRIDHLFHDEQIDVHSYRVKHDPWSDHFPVICSFNLNKEE